MDRTNWFRGWMAVALVCVGVVVVFQPTMLWAQITRGPAPVSVDVPDRINGTAGSIVQFDVTLSIEENWHVNANPASMESLIPTRVSLTANNPSSVSLASVDYPEGQKYRFEFADRPLSVYQGRVPLSVQLRIDPSTELGTHSLEFKVQYQACDDRRCLPPRREHRNIELELTGQSRGEPGGLRTVWGSAMNDPDEGTLVNTFRRRGVVAGLVVVFLLGLSLNLTPCVYPMVPITVGYFGGRDRDELSGRIIDAVFFVLGMAIVYAILGGLAGFGGSMLGNTLQNPWIQVGLAGVMVVLASSMFGLFELKLPAPVKQQSEQFGKALGTFGMGMTLGVVAAPCLAPATVALLGFVGQLGSIYAGAGLFFVLALGLGLPYVFLALFSSELHRLPGSGEWMEWVKLVLGFLILGVAIYFLWPMLTNEQFAYLMIALIAVAVGVLSWSYRPESTIAWVSRTVVVLVVGAGLGFMVGWTFLGGAPSVEWDKPIRLPGPESPAEQPTLVYVGASWCVPCKEMEVTTFRDDRVRRQLSDHLRSVKIDVSTPPPARIDEWLGARKVMGVPTIMLFDGGGERRSLRMAGYVGAESLLEKIRTLKQSAR